MIKQLERTLNGTYYAANTTVSFPTNPFISANSNLSLWFTSNDSKFSAIATSVTANNVVVNFGSIQYDTQPVVIHTPCFGGGLTGLIPKFSMSTSTTPNTLLQATVYNGGTNSANVSIQVSNDNIGWIVLGNVSLTAANTSGYINNQLPWAYGRLNIVDISAGSILQVSKAT
jgi:hypothetical protein